MLKVLVDINEIVISVCVVEELKCSFADQLDFILQPSSVTSVWKACFCLGDIEKALQC